MKRASRAHAGFTLIEVIVVIAVITLLAGVVVPMVASYSNEGRVAKILSIIDAVRSGAQRHYVDTGRMATEYSGSTYTQDRFHELSRTQKYSGWKGPYIDHPLTQGDHPFGGQIYMYENLVGGPARPNGFVLTGTGGSTTTGSGQFVGFSAVPEDVAKKVDAALDRNIPGDWKSFGRVEYVNGYVCVYLLQP